MPADHLGNPTRLFGKIMACILTVIILFSFSSSLHAATPGTDSPDGSKSKHFAVQSPNFEGSQLVFHYVCPFPGVTKVKLFDSAGNLLWRGQYNDTEGNNEARFRLANLNSGETYVFKFEYKLESVLRSVSVP